MLFSSPSKIPQILEEIDAARSKGQWQAIPNLARRYMKHNPEGTGLEQIILAEANLVQLSQSKKTWDSKDVRTIQDQLQSVFEFSDGTSEEHKESAKIVLARLFFGCQEYDQALALLDGISLLNTQSSGYSFILYYQSMAIKAISMEMMGDIQPSLQTYEIISTLLDDRLPICDLTLLEWAEQVLYRVNQLLRNQSFSFIVDQGTVLEFMRSYHRATGDQPVSWRTERRLEISLQMVKLLSKLYQSDEYVPYGLVGITELTDAQLRRKAFIDEISHLYASCAQLLQATTSFPNSGESNTLILDMVESLANDLDLIMETTEDWHGYKEVLEWASEKTFNSSPILRLLFCTCFRLGEYEEAQHALTSYLQAIGLVSYEHMESSKNGAALIQDIHGRYLPAPQPLLQQHVSHTTFRNNHDEHTSGKKGNAEDEYFTCQLEVLLESIKMFCSKELEMGRNAVNMANMALTLIQTSESTSLDSQLEARVYRASGVAFGLLATQTIDREQRPKYHEKALSLLQRSNFILSDSWETNYCLARQYASMLNIDRAIQLVRHSLDLNIYHIPSWHLLTLALSCSGQKGHSQALEVAITGLDIGNRASSSKLSLYDRQEQQLLLKMTYCKLVNSTRGPEKALDEHTALIKLYGKWVVEGTIVDRVDFSSVDGDADAEIEHVWQGRTSCGDDDKVPRKLVVSGPLGNSPSIVFSSQNQDMASIHSSLMVPPANTPNMSMQCRSASSSMINHFTLPDGNDTDSTNCESSSIGSPSLIDSSIYKGDTLGLKPNDAIPSTIPQRTPSLRKYASNSALKPSGYGQYSRHHWHGTHLSLATEPKFNSNDTHHIALSMIGSASSESIGKDSFSYNSVHSIQNTHSIGRAGSTTSSTLHESNDTAQAASLSSFLIPNKQQLGMTTRGYYRHQRQYSRLCELWLMAAQWYLELSELNEAMKAISEAESACPDHPDLWCLMGQLHSQKIHSGTSLSTDDNRKKGYQGWDEQQNLTSPMQVFEKGLLHQPGHVDCQLGLAKLYMDQQNLCLAEGMLTSVTQGFGWQSSEAWYLLAQIYRQTKREQETKDYLFYALDLELSRPIQPFAILPLLV